MVKECLVCPPVLVEKEKPEEEFKLALIEKLLKWLQSKLRLRAHIGEADGYT